MRSLFPKLVAVAVAVVLAAPALAQRPGGPGGMSPATLLGNKSVQDELKLTADQKDAIKKIVEERNKAFQKAREDMDFGAMREAGQKATKALAKVKADLKPAQAKRLKQIYLQVAGAGALANPEIQKDLGLKDKQKDESKDTLANLQKEAQGLFRGAAGDREKMAEAFKKMQDLNKKAQEKITKVLTDEQQKKLKEMKGPKFEIKPDRPPRRPE